MKISNIIFVNENYGMHFSAVSLFPEAQCRSLTQWWDLCRLHNNKVVVMVMNQGDDPVTFKLLAR